jgi:hypothetical protein
MPQKFKKVGTAIIIAIVILGVLWFLWWLLEPMGFLPRLGSQYQAVFLSNGQVYFGKLYRERSQYPILREVYYLQVMQQLQPGTENPTANINLVKLGAELHGPTDEMRINRDHILFIEDLKDDSQVVQGIKRFKEGKR